MSYDDWKTTELLDPYDDEGELDEDEFDDEEPDEDDRIEDIAHDGLCLRTSAQSALRRARKLPTLLHHAHESYVASSMRMQSV